MLATMKQFTDFATLERARTSNSYLVAPEGLCTKSTVDDDAPVFRTDPDALFANVKAMVTQDPQFQDVSADDGKRALRMVAVTKILKFKDDVDVWVLPAEGGATVAVYSRSRVGRSDFGTNRRRIVALLGDVRKDAMLAEGEGGVTLKDPGYSEVGH
jgi:uncharacterized protein (DUF1499 family)